MEQELVYFGENSIIKSTFHKNKRPININEVDTEEMVLSHKRLQSKDSFKYFIDTDIKIMLFYHHCA